MFISHSSADNDAIARPLARALEEEGILVWFDEFEIIWGDSIIEKINEGIRKSVIGIIIFSPSLVKQDNWGNHESRIFTQLMIEGKFRLLPLLHNITKEEVFGMHQLISDRKFMRSDVSLKDLVQGVKENLKYIDL